MERRAVVSNAVDRRRREFAAGRAAARVALQKLGLPACAIPSRADRSPTWPTGIVGSISHTRDMCVAALALRSDHAAIGIDVEADAGIDPSLWEIICTPWEIARLQHVVPLQRSRQVTRIFTAKEAFFKWQFPTSGRLIDFQDVHVSVNNPHSFTVYPVSTSMSDSMPGAPEGHWMAESGMIVAWMLQSQTTKLALHRLAQGMTTGFEQHHG